MPPVDPKPTDSKAPKATNLRAAEDVADTSTIKEGKRKGTRSVRLPDEQCRSFPRRVLTQSASRTGPRSVTTLSSEQLERKRAIDREAQRAIRQRTKDRIEALERRIRDLTGNLDGNKEFDDAQRRSDELEAELKQLKESISLLRSHEGSSCASQHGSVSGLSTSNQASTTSSELSSSALTSMESTSKIWHSRPSSSGSFYPMISYLGPADTIRSAPEIPNSTTYNYILGHGYPSSSHSGGGQELGWPPVSLSIHQSGLDTVINDTSSFMLTGPQSTESRVQSVSITPSLVRQPSHYVWELPLRFTPPTGPVDNILLGILQRQRSLVACGTTGPKLIGPNRPNLRELIYPDHSNQTHPITSMLSSLLQRTALRDLPVKAAALILIYRLSQWQISPTTATYNNLADWHTPRTSQMITPHPIWASQIIWGKLRDKVIENQDFYATEEFQHLYTLSLNINWPYRPVDALVFEGGEVRVTNTFESHVKRLANWSLDDPFARRYPELRDDCKFTEDRVQDLDDASHPAG